jgi:hypothetical protein
MVEKSCSESLQEDVYNNEYVSKAIQSLARKEWTPPTIIHVSVTFSM